MLRLARRTVAVATLLVATLLAAGPAFADDPATSAPATSPSPAATHWACLDEKAGYEPQGPCQLIVDAKTVCKGDAPYLQYDVTALGTPNTTTTLVWGDENGKHYTMSDLPLHGEVLWPGAAVDADGHATDWPGWTLVDGVWVEHDEWDWVRPQVPLTFHVNPSAQIPASYPEATAPCANPPTVQTAVLAEDDRSAVLAMTGSDARHLGLVAAALVVLGGLLIVARSRSRKRTAER